jgi:outer membrane protein FlgP
LTQTPKFTLQKKLKTSVAVSMYPSSQKKSARTPGWPLAFMEKYMTSNRSMATALLAISLAGCQAVPLNIMGSTKSSVPANPASMITPLVEKRETLVATGYAVISVQNHKNPAQQRLLAIRASKLDAYRALTEQVYGQQLDATTTVADMTVMSDTFRAKVEGVVYGAVLVSIAPVGDDTYETTLSLDQQVVRDLRTLYLGQLAARRK